MMTDTACRVCGLPTDLNIEVKLGYTPLGQRDGNDYAVGCCESCQTLLPDVPGSAVRACLRLIKKPESEHPAYSEVLADMEIDAADVLFEVTGHPRRGPQRRAFGHVPKDVRGALKRAYAAMLQERVLASLPQPEPTPEPPPEGFPRACLACGVGLSLQWFGEVSAAYVLTRTPETVTGWLCDACGPVLQVVGAVGQPFIERAVMEAEGLPWSDAIRIPNLRAWVAEDLPPQDIGWDWLDLTPPPLNLDPMTALQEMVAELTERVDALQNEVATMRGVMV